MLEGDALFSITVTSREYKCDRVDKVTIKLVRDHLCYTPQVDDLSKTGGMVSTVWTAEPQSSVVSTWGIFCGGDIRINSFSFHSNRRRSWIAIDYGNFSWFFNVIFKYNQINKLKQLVRRKIKMIII